MVLQFPDVSRLAEAKSVVASITIIISTAFAVLFALLFNKEKLDIMTFWFIAGAVLFIATYIPVILLTYGLSRRQAESGDKFQEHTLAMTRESRLLVTAMQQVQLETAKQTKETAELVRTIVSGEK